MKLALLAAVAAAAPTALAWGAAGKLSLASSGPSSSTTPTSASTRPSSSSSPFLALQSGPLADARSPHLAGHEIVATIAQIHLHPQVRDQLCRILPRQAGCHLAPVAAWADMVRRQYPETGPMHYVNREYAN